MFRVTKSEASNKTIRMPDNLIERLEKLAQKHDVSFNKVVVQCCIYALKNLENEDKIEQDYSSEQNNNKT